jgi:hypothetical protein
MSRESKTGIIILIITLLISWLLSSCNKEPITPGNYQFMEPIPDTTNWQDDYNNGGTLPNWGNGNTVENNISGTNWVLIDVNYNYAHVTKNDTVHFISNTKYTIGSDTTKYTYSLYETMGNSTLQLNMFIPINGLNLSANNFPSSVFKTAPVGGEILLNLKDLLSPSSIYRSTFKKI